MNNNEIAKELILEEIIAKSVQIPGVKVERKRFLAEEFSTEVENIQDVMENGPVEAGVSREVINKIALKLIIKRTSQSSIASFVAGIPGGLAMAATIPADVLQFFGMSLRLAQELSYLYGAEDLWQDGKVDNEKIKNQLILYCGVMFGVSGSVSGVRVLSTQVAKTTLKKLPQKALTKTFWYPIIKKIMSQVGVKITKTTFAQGVSKAVPVVGGVISGSINFASMMPMAKRLNETLDKAIFDYSDAEFENDIDAVLNVTNDVNEELKDEDNIFVTTLNNVSEVTKKGLSTFADKLKQATTKKTDPYEEIKKLKEFLDMGIISQEEFDKKKSELLEL